MRVDSLAVKFIKHKDRQWGQEALAMAGAIKAVPARARKPRAPETKKRVLLEKKIERDIIWALNNRGCVCAKSGESAMWNSRHCLTGMSDLTVFVPQRKTVVFMEVKTPKTIATADQGLRETQRKFKLICEGCDLEHYVVASVEDAVKHALKGIHL